MAARDSLAPVQHSVFAVLQAATHELRELQIRHAELTWRIRSVRSAVNALRRWHGRSVQRQQSSKAGGPTSAHDLARHQLMRACRIALLETYDAMSEEEVYARIVRRGSFHFPDPSAASRAIAGELAAMAARGEVLRINAPAGIKWQRIGRDTSLP